MIFTVGPSRTHRAQARRQRIRRASVVTALACAATLTGPAVAGATTARPPAASPAGPQATLTRALDRLVSAGMPGAMGIERDQGREWRAAAGVADLQTGAPMRAGDKFRIGSMTKAFIATVILQLVGEHRLSLGDTVSHWLPGLVPNGNHITIRELMNMTSGLYDYIDLPFYLNLLHHPLRAWSPVALVKRAVTHPPLFPPGTQWSYSNTNYVLLGLVVAAVDRAPAWLRYADPALEAYARVIWPLRLGQTSFPLTDPRISGPHTHGYLIGAPAAWHVPPVLDTTNENPSWAWTAGAIVSTLDDVADFHLALFTGRLLAPAQQKELETTVPAAPGLRYGLGVFRVQTPCGPAWGHDGGTPNAVSISLTSPDGGHQAAIMVNRDENTWTNAMFTDFASAYLTAYCGRAVSGTQARSLVPATAALLREAG